MAVTAVGWVYSLPENIWFMFLEVPVMHEQLYNHIFGEVWLELEVTSPKRENCIPAYTQKIYLAIPVVVIVSNCVMCMLINNSHK